MPDLNGMFWADALILLLLFLISAMPVVYFAGKITELREEIPLPESDQTQLLEAVIACYLENAEAIFAAYDVEETNRGASQPNFATRLSQQAQNKAIATTTTPDSGMLMASSQTSQGNALLSGPTRPADVAYNYALAELNPIRYRGYYRDAETGWYFCQTRYYNPQWRQVPRIYFSSKSLA